MLFFRVDGNSTPLPHNAWKTKIKLLNHQTIRTTSPLWYECHIWTVTCCIGFLTVQKRWLVDVKSVNASVCLNMQDPVQCQEGRQRRVKARSVTGKTKRWEEVCWSKNEISTGQGWCGELVVISTYLFSHLTNGIDKYLLDNNKTAIMIEGLKIMRYFRYIDDQSS